MASCQERMIAVLKHCEAPEKPEMRAHVQHGRSGILVPVGNSEEICAALKKLVDDADLRRSMGEAGFQLILKEHRIEETARRYVDVFTGGGSAPGS
jgi:glycosyltransferase involved in cell wall biosynthesis